MLGDVVGVMAVQGVPGDCQRHRQELEWNGALDRLLGAVAGVADPEEFLGFLVGNLGGSAV